MQNVPQLFDRLGGPTEIAKLTGYPFPTVYAWKHRESIPVEHWPNFIAAAQKVGLKLSTDDLARIQPPRRKRGAA